MNPKQLRADIQSQVSAGRSQRQIAKTLGVPRSTVYDIIHSKRQTISPRTIARAELGPKPTLKTRVTTVIAESPRWTKKRLQELQGSGFQSFRAIVHSTKYEAGFETQEPRDIEDLSELDLDTLAAVVFDVND